MNKELVESSVEMKNETSDVLTKSCPLNETLGKNTPNAETSMSETETVYPLSLDQNKQKMERNNVKSENKDFTQEEYEEVKSNSSSKTFFKEGLIGQSTLKEAENEADVIIPMIIFEHPSVEEMEQKIDNVKENENKDVIEKNMRTVDVSLTQNTEPPNQNDTDTAGIHIDDNASEVPR